jgi:hypothetical protein
VEAGVLATSAAVLPFCGAAVLGITQRAEGIGLIGLLGLVEFIGSIKQIDGSVERQKVS